MTKLIFSTATTITALVATAMGAPAYAQTATPAADQSADSSNLNDIVVTARKRVEKLLDVPVPVSVATKEQLSRDQIYTISDLQRVTPALEVSQTSGGQINGGARLRGLGTGVFNNSVSSSVAFQVDQVPQGNLSFPQLFDLAQVEVLRGPQGTLFGQGASAGVVNVSTVAPSTEKLSFSIGADYSDKGTAGSEFGQRVVRSAINIPLSSDVAVRVAGQYKSERGLQRNVLLGLDNKLDDYGIRARLLARPTSNLTLNLSAEYDKNNTNGINFFAIAISPTGTSNSAASLAAYTSPTGTCRQSISERGEEYCSEATSTSTSEAMTFSNVADLKLGNITLSSVTAYRALDAKTPFFDLSRLAGFPVAAGENSGQKSSQFSQEIRASYDGNGLNLIIGGLYSKFVTNTYPLIGGAFNLTAPGKRIGFSVCTYDGTFCVLSPSFTRERTYNSTAALFADATFSLSDQWDVFGGLRYTDYSNTTGVGADTLTPTRYSTIKDNNLSGRIGARFRPTNNVTIYGSVARGYKPPAIVVPVSNALSITNLRPEIATAVELGAKAKAGRFQVEGNIFYTSVKDFQSQTSVFVGTALVSTALNINRLVSKGLEITAFGNVSDHLAVSGGYQFNIMKFPSGYVGDDGVDISGRQFLNAPKHKITFSTEYTQPMSEAINLFVNGNVVYKSGVLLAARGDPRYVFGSHATIGGAIGLRSADDKWKASIFVRNLTKQREPTGYLASTYLGSIDGGLRAWPVAGLTARQVGLSVDFNF